MPTTTPVAEPREVVEVEGADGRVERLELVGPSLWGSVHRSLERGEYHRLIPSAYGITAEMRDEVTQWCDRARQPGIAPIVEARQTTAAGVPCLLVRYEADVPATLLEALASDEPAARVRAVAATVRALPGWWGRLGAGLVPMPSDVLLPEDAAQLLAMPPWGIPAVEALFDEPARARHLAPEIVCGRARESWANASDLYALGVMLLQCFARLPDDDAERTLAQVANGTVFAPGQCESTLAFWLQKVDAVQAAIALARRLVDPRPKARSAVDPQALADQLDACPAAMDPVAAVDSLWDSGRPQEARELADDVLLDEPSYDLYLLAARVSWRSLRNSLDALSLLEKAVALDSTRTEAYGEQIELISSLKNDIIALLATAVDASFADRLDATMWTAFNRLPPDRQGVAEPDVARYLIDREQFAQATQFVHRRLHDAQGTLHWWKFELMLSYAEAFLGLDRVDDADRVVGEVKAGLAKVRENRTVPEGRIHEYGARLAQLELRAHARRKEGSIA